MNRIKYAEQLYALISMCLGVVIKTMDVYDENGNYVGSTHWYSDGTCDDPYSAGMGGF